MKQREAVFTAVCDVTKNSEFDSAVELTKEQRESVHTQVMEGFGNDKVDFSDSAKAKYDTEAKLSSYVSGLISNWLRKDKRLNGNTTYTPKNPGSRAGQGDPQIRELRKLLKIHAGSDKEAEIQGFINTRLSKIQSEKVKSVDIDYSQLPAKLRDLAPVEDDEAA